VWACDSGTLHGVCEVERARRAERCRAEVPERRRVEAPERRGARASARAGVALACGLVAGLFGLGRAQAAELSARGPAECPDATELTFRVERAIGMPLGRAAPLRFSVQFMPARAASYTARLAVESSEPSGQGSERLLGPRPCAQLADAVAVAIALALGSTEPQASPSPEPAAGASPGAAEPGAASPAPLLSPEDEARGAAARSEPAGLTPALGVWLVGDAGSLPGAGLGLGLAAELRVARFAVRAAGTWLFDRHVTLPGAGAPALGADMSLALGNVSACSAPFASASLSASICAGWELGRLDALGTGVRDPRRAGALWSAPRVDLELAWATGDNPLRLVAQLSAATPLKRDDFFLRDLGSVYRPPVVAGRLALGVDVSFE
jgi:hypothetical protein